MSAMSGCSGWGIRKGGWLAGFLLAIVFLPVSSEGQDFEGRTISSLTFRYRGPQTVDENRLLGYMRVREGQRYSAEVLDEDIVSLYESGLVDDVSFFGELEGENAVRLIVEVVTRPARAGVGFVGNTVFSDKKLAKVTELEGSGPLSDQEILSARRKIEEHYRGFGYPDVLVTHRLQETERPGYADLVFVIDEGVKSEVRKIRFEGNRAFRDVELRREMETKQKGLFSFFTKSGRINPEQLQQDLERVKDFYRNRGYLRVRIGEVRREPAKKGRVDLVIPVYEGEKYTVQSVSFGKMSVFRPEELEPALSLTARQPYSAEKMRDDIRMIRSYYGSRGYADAAVTPDIRDAGPGAVSVVYQVTEGRRYRVGRVNIQGNTITKDRVIRREVPMKPGDWYNSVDEEATRRRLQNLNYFDPVQVSGAPGGQAGYRDVNILVSEKRTGSISFGAGFSSIDSIVGYMNLEQTNFDLMNPGGWFRGGGQRFGLDLRLGNQRQDFKISLVEPWFLGRQLALGGELYYRDLLFLSDVYDQRNYGGAVFIRKKAGRRGYVRLEYRLEKVKVDVDADVSDDSLFAGEDDDYLRSAVGLNYVYDSRDSNITPRRGHRLDAGLTAAGGIFGGDVDAYTVSVKGSKHWNLPWDLILNLSGAAAVTGGFGAGDDEVPVFERQFLGGARDLRGFDFREIGSFENGTRDMETGEAFGGLTSAYVTTEVSFPVIENIRGAVFYDVGLLNGESWDFAPDQIYSDAGMGLRLNLPIGPLALDYAVPLTSDEESDQGGQFNFYLNYQF